MPPDAPAHTGGNRWINPIAFLSGIFFINMISRLGFAPLLPVIETELGISHNQAGGLFFFISAGYCTGLFSTIFLTPHLTHRTLIIFAGVGIGFSLISTAVCPGLFLLRTNLVCLGLAGGVYLPSGVATLTAVVSQKHWGKVLSLHQLSPNLAYILAPVAAELFLSRYSWRLLLLVYGTASLVLGIAYARWGRGLDTRTEPPRVRSLWSMVHDPALIIITILFIMGIGMNQGVFAIMPLYLTVERGMATGWGNTLVSLSRVAAFGLPLAGGWLADRFGVLRVMTTAFACAILGTVSVALLSDTWIWIALVLQAGASVCVFPLCFSLMSMITTPNTRAVAVSVVVPIAHLLGAGVVPLGMGILAEAGRFDTGFLVLGGLTTLCLPLAYGLKKSVTTRPG